MQPKQQAVKAVNADQSASSSVELQQMVVPPALSGLNKLSTIAVMMRRYRTW